MEVSLSDSYEQVEAIEASGREWRRLRLIDVVQEQLEGWYRTHVLLETPDGARYAGRYELPGKGDNHLRAPCQATLAALRRLLGGAVELELIGVRVVAMEDTSLIVVQIASRARGRPKLLQGVALASESPELDAVRAVLHATNRMLAKVLKG